MFLVEFFCANNCRHWVIFLPENCTRSLFSEKQPFFPWKITTYGDEKQKPSIIDDILQKGWWWKFSEERIAAICEMKSTGKRISDIARVTGLSRPTTYRVLGEEVVV